MTRYTISTLDPAPAMTETRVNFTGTYQEAVEATKASWRQTGRSTHLFSEDGHFWWFHIDKRGNTRDRNVIGHQPIVMGFVD